MYVLYVLAFGLAILGGYQLSVREEHQEHLNGRHESVARMMGLYHAAAVRTCDIAPCAVGAIDVSSELPGVVVNAVLQDGRYTSVSDGTGLVVTVFTGTAQTGFSQDVVAAAVKMTFGSRRGVGRWDAAAGSVGSFRPASGIDNRISVPSNVGGVAFADGQVMIATD